MQYYIVNLWDAATPSFISADKSYVGIKKELESFAELSEDYEDLKKWCNGEDVEPSTFLPGMYIPNEIEVLKTKKFEDKTERYFDHINVWECTYNMFYKSLKGKFVYFKKDNKFFRSFYVDNVVGLSYVISGDEIRRYCDIPIDIKRVYHALSDHVWGNKNIIFVKKQEEDLPYNIFDSKDLNHELKSILGYVDKEFETEEDMLKDYEKPEQCEIRLFIDDFFADG